MTIGFRYPHPGIALIRRWWRRTSASVGLVALVVGLLAGCGGGSDRESSSGEHSAHFGYGPTDGPSHWASLDPAYAECADGKRQSPIDLTGGSSASLAPIRFTYHPSKVEVDNNGHSLEANYEPGSAITIAGARSGLERFHFHAPSEHHVNGKVFPLEIHFVYPGPGGHTTVLGVLIRQGRANPAFEPLIHALPKQVGRQLPIHGGLNPTSLMPPHPQSAPRWSYSGSLTTPPCTEGIGWQLFRRPVELSREQIAAFTDIYDHNARPIQPLNGRRLLHSP
jgi:carbonic anhydrase